ncbi:MAG: phosphoribosyl 1,2-cyclic phosphodiesterase [Phenylobacterium sp.]|jgi:phosphoribosyl 1,2-cyclic phosphodiesterase
MKISFYGVRGSCPAPGKDTVKYGGNTACVLVTADDGRKLVLDAGTGIRLLGNEMKHQEPDIHIVLTHNHWDHIQGFPFFVPAYLREHTLHIYPGNTDLNHNDAVLEQMSKSFFPVHYKVLKAKIKLYTEPYEHKTINGFAISRYDLNHPGGGSAYIVECDGRRLAYITDTELNPPYPVKTSVEQWIDILHDVDLLIHDAQFMPSELPLKSGWGHSLAFEAVDLAKAANVKKLALYSHDPSRTDAAIDKIIADIHAQNLPFDVIAAMEGSTLTV